ncbi:MAG TPA: hypothetical protein VMZ06_00855 [Candidatus Bathyarchaeia archaeon]|nr:hypothetical protein [Candidatus Bathyarchaeia archaeon]
MFKATTLNDHIRRDAVRRLWRMYILFLVIGLFASCFFMLPVDLQQAETALRQVFGRSPAVLFGGKYPRGLLLIPIIMGITYPLLGFVASSLLAQVEKPVFRLYAALPTDARQRGRMIWWRQAIVAPSLVWVMPITLTALLLNLEPCPWRALMFMAAWRAFLVSLVLPSLLLIVGGWSLCDVTSRLGLLMWAVTVPVALIHYAAFLRFGLAAFGPFSWLLFLTPILSLLALSYARAPRLALANPIKEPLPRWPQVPNAPESLANFIFSVTTRTVGAAYLLFIVLGIIASVIDIPARTDRMFSFFAMDSMAAGILTFTIFITAGRFISEQMRLLRLLPLSPGRIALAALLYATAATALTMPAISLATVIATPGRSPFIIAGAVLLAADAGCLAAALQVRLGRWAAQINLLLFAAFFLIIMALSTPIHEQPAIVNPVLLRVALAAFLLCLLIGFIAIRRAIQLTSAGVYRDFFLEKFAPQ